MQLCLKIFHIWYFSLLVLGKFALCNAHDIAYSDIIRWKKSHFTIETCFITSAIISVKTWFKNPDFLQNFQLVLVSYSWASQHLICYKSSLHPLITTWQMTSISLVTCDPFDQWNLLIFYLWSNAYLFKPAIRHP